GGEGPRERPRRHGDEQDLFLGADDGAQGLCVVVMVVAFLVDEIGVGVVAALVACTFQLLLLPSSLPLQGAPFRSTRHRSENFAQHDLGVAERVRLPFELGKVG
ncbi:unnamed protein product, partial [Scytosiphon promiscuus]